MLGKVTSGSSCSLTSLLSLTLGVPDSYDCPYSGCQIPAVPWLFQVTLTPPAAVAIPDLSLPNRASTQGVRVKLLACSEDSSGSWEPECGAGGSGSARWALALEMRPREEPPVLSSPRNTCYPPGRPLQPSRALGLASHPVNPELSEHSCLPEVAELILSHYSLP